MVQRSTIQTYNSAKPFRITAIILVLLSILALLVITNPTKDDYVEWAKEKVINNNNSDFVKAPASWRGSPQIDSSTTTDNYYIFTVFHTNVAGNNFNVLGIFKQFILLDSIKVNSAPTSDSKEPAPLPTLPQPEPEEYEPPSEYDPLVAKEILLTWNPEWRDQEDVRHDLGNGESEVLKIDSEWDPEKEAFLFHVFYIMDYSDEPGHTATIGWYLVDPETGHITDEITGERIQ